MKTLRVLIDARKYGDGGIGRYLEWLTLGLSEIDSVEQTLLVTDIADVPLGVRAKDIIVSSCKKYSLLEYVTLLRDINAKDFDVFHTPHYTLPFFSKIPSVVTLHDIIHISHPSRWYHPVIAKLLIGSAVQRAKQLITVSHSAKDEIVRHFPNAAKKITVIGHPPPTWQTDERQITAEPYLLSVISQDRAHKGVDDIIAVLKAIQRSIALPVVLAGFGVEGRKQEKIGNNIFIEGMVSEEKLKQLYAGSSGVIIPSRTEGFGFAAIEAKLFSKKVFCRPAPALLELVDAKDSVAASMSIQDFKNGLLEFAVSCVRDPVGTSLDQSKYDRAALVQQTISVYRKAAESLL